MTTFEGKIATVAPDKGWGAQDNTELFRAAIGRPIEIHLPTINGPVRGLAKVLRIDGAEAVVEFTVDELAPDQLADLFGDDWRKPTVEMFGAAVEDIVVRGGDDDDPAQFDPTWGGPARMAELVRKCADHDIVHRTFWLDVAAYIESTAKEPGR